MQSKTVTIKTIARKFGVSPATVSKALHDRPDISKETKKKIKDLAKELGYRPNLMARNLVKKRSNIIGIIVPDISTSFFGFTVRGINKKARALSFETIILVNNEDYKVERKNLEFLYNLQVDGIIIDSVPGNHNIDLLQDITDKGLPIVFIDRKCDEILADSVTTNDVKAGYSITKYFIERGKRKIAFVGAIEKLSVAYNRFLGYKKALSDYKIKFNKKLIIPIDYEIDDKILMNKVRKFINSGNEFDAFISTGGLIAYLVGIVLKNEGYSISKDILLGEFGDNNIVHRLGVPFVAIDQSPYEIGQKAMELIYDRIMNPALKNKKRKNIFVKSQLIFHNPAENKHSIIQKNI